MNQPQEDPQKLIASLRTELDSVKRREAEYRTKMIQEFLDKGERNTYLHTLHEQRAALIKREQESFADLEFLVRKIEESDRRIASLESQLHEVWNSTSWKLTAPLRSKSKAQGTGSPSEQTRVEGAAFTYYLHTSPFRVYREARFTLRGWAWPQDGRAVAAIRVNIDGKTFIGRHGLEEPEVVARYGVQPANPRPGFEVTFETTPGKHHLSLEALLDGNDWRWIVQTTIWCEQPPAS